MVLLAVRFVVEIAGIVALAVIGAGVPAEPAVRIVLGVGLPIALIAAWGRFLAPRAASSLSQRTRQVVGSALLVGIGTLLALAGQPGWGIVLALVVVADHLLIIRLGLEDPSATLGAFASEGGR